MASKVLECRKILAVKVLVNPKLEEKLEEIHIFGPNDYRVIKFGAKFLLKIKEQLTRLIKENIKVFAWTMVDMPRMDHQIVTYKLAIDPNAKLI